MITLTPSVYATLATVSGAILWMLTDFAVGFSRQPLPKGTCFAVVTNSSGAGIRATDATACCGLDLISLRPEINRPIVAKLSPTAKLFQSLRADRTRRNHSIAMGPRAGYNKITNGVRQELFGARLPGVEIRP